MKERLIVKPVESRKDSLLDSELRLDISKRIVTPFIGNNILFASMEPGLEVVIKIPVRKGYAEREWIGLNKTYNAGVPVPEPLMLAHDREGRSMLISRKVEGKNLYDQPGTEMKYQLGKIVRLMHEQTSIDGKEWAESNKPSFVYYDRHLFYWLHGPIEELKQGSKAQILLSKFADVVKDHCRKISPVFNHNDIHDSQAIIEGNNLVLIDFEEWAEESKLNELAMYLYHTIKGGRSAQEFREFIHSYLGGSSLNDNERLILTFYLLFISAGAVSFFHRRRPTYLETARTNHQKILEYIDQERPWKEF